jgi:hypothetical protein
VKEKEKINFKEDAKNEIKQVIKQLKKCDERKEIDEKAKSIMMDKLVVIGKPAVSSLIELLNNHDTMISSSFAADVLGEIGDKRAIGPLADALEESELGENAYEALKKFGPVCIPEVIKRIEYRIAHPIKKGPSIDLITSHGLNVIGEIKCDKSIEFLNNLLDDYMSEMPNETFDPTKYEWKYRNVDFFHLLDCMVRQQDKRAIPHIRKARDFFPENYTDYKVCQIAIGRIKKGKVEGYLPMEALEICMPSGRIMDLLSGGEFGWEDTFEENYGEYFDED